MTESTPLDDRGRFTLDPRYRKLLGRRVVQVLTPDGVLLKPVRGRLPRGALPSALAIDGDRLYARETRRRRGVAR